MSAISGKHIKELREENNLTQVELAKILDTSAQNISAYENGREPSYDTLSKISKTFDCSVDYLIGRSDFKNFNHELQFKKRKGNEEVAYLDPDDKAILFSINEQFSEIINDLIANKGNVFYSDTLVMFNRILIMILYIKKTLRESDSEMKFYIDVMKMIKKKGTFSARDFGNIEICQRQINAAKKIFNSFLSLIGQGVDTQTVASRLGHSTSATLQKVYSHFLRKPDIEAADKLENLFGEKKVNTKKA